MVDDDEKRTGEFKRVFEEFRHGVETVVSPEDLATHCDLGVAYFEMGMLADARAEFEAVLRVDPQHVRARGWLVRLGRGGGPPDDVA